MIKSNGVAKLGLICSVLWLFGCGAEPNIQFESDRYSIRAGESISLIWDAGIDDEGTQTHVVSIGGLGNVALSGALLVNPDETTLYSLVDVRTSSDGTETTLTKDITVQVDLLLADWQPKDLNFERCVKEQNEGRLYVLDVTKVDCRYVSSLEGAQYLGQLSDLRITKGLLSDISPIKTLNNLANIGFASVPIKDLEPLAGMTDVFSLYVFDTSVTDVSPIGSMTNVVGVWLGMNRITDGLSALEPLLAQMSVYAGWIDFRSSVFAIENPNKRMDCDALSDFLAQTEFGSRVFSPEYCELDE